MWTRLCWTACSAASALASDCTSLWCLLGCPVSYWPDATVVVLELLLARACNSRSANSMAAVDQPPHSKSRQRGIGSLHCASDLHEGVRCKGTAGCVLVCLEEQCSQSRGTMLCLTAARLLPCPRQQHCLPEPTIKRIRPLHALEPSAVPPSKLHSLKLSSLYSSTLSSVGVSPGSLYV